MGKRHNLTAIIRNKRGLILSIGNNSYLKTHTVMYRLEKNLGVKEPKKTYLHAEISAIIKCKNISKAYSIEVYRVGKNGDYLCSKPCKLCLLCITETPIKVIKYFNKNNELIEEFI